MNSGEFNSLLKNSLSNLQTSLQIKKKINLMSADGNHSFNIS